MAEIQQYDVSTWTGAAEKSAIDAKKFEQLAILADPLYPAMIIGIELVKQFIRDNKLILYGGSAIDYALKLAGSCIPEYKLVTVPDLDFYSDNSIEHSYQLADVLFAAGFAEARAICATHMATMRVDIGFNHWMADITYRPKCIMDVIPTLIYDGMRVVHPDYQRIDSHSALSFPYDEPPREVIFSRWKKDIRRFNLMDDAYPISSQIASGTVSKSSRHTFAIAPNRFVLSGFAAYNALYAEYVRGKWDASDIIKGEFIAEKDKIVFDAPSGGLDIVHFDLEKAASELFGVDKHTYYEPFANMLPSRAVCGDITIHDTGHRLLSIVELRVDTIAIRTVCVQYLLKYFMSMFIAKKEIIYRDYYWSLLEMVKRSSVLPLAGSSSGVSNPFGLSITTYGRDNISVAKEIALNRVYADITGITRYKTPTNYYPAKNKASQRPHPTFDYTGEKFFQESGKQIVDDADNDTNNTNVSSK